MTKASAEKAKELLETLEQIEGARAFIKDRTIGTMVLDEVFEGLLDEKGLMLAVKTTVLTQIGTKALKVQMELRGLK